MTELPRWQCHKIVRAAKILAMTAAPASSAAPERLGILLTLEGADGPVMLWRDEAWRQRFNPARDGYFVEYDDSYTSYSPAAAFEAGYTRLE